MMVSRRQAEARVYFFESPAIPGPKSDLYKSASRIPGVRVLSDRDGVVARQFGARTSGQALLYSAAGHLVFNGGITAARGHVGPNDGVDSILALLNGSPPLRHAMPVFGCTLYGGN
jgi:hypothetical protein